MSVVIPALNAERTIGEQLTALARQDFEESWELVIADNGSTDGTLDVVHDHRGAFDNLEVVDASAKRGVSHARNSGVQAARGEFIAICDADDVASTSWLSALVEAASRADLVGGALEYSYLNDERWRRARNPVAAHSLPRPMGFLPFASGANLGVWRDVYNSVGGWDEDYRAGGDDIDFSWRCQLKGYSLALALSAIMHYRLRPSLKAHMRQAFNYSRSSPHLYRRYRAQGARRATWRGVVYSWSRALLLPLFEGEFNSDRWLLALTRKSGLLVGAIQARVIYI